MESLHQSPHVIIEAITHHTPPGEWSDAMATRVRRQFQRTLAARLRAVDNYSPHHRMRHKLARWWLPSVPRPTTDRILARLQRLGKLVPPRVVAAVLGSLWNKWPTARRLQGRAPCLMRCSSTAQDSLEHYACCPIVQGAAHRHLSLPASQWPNALLEFLLCSPGILEATDTHLTKRALLLYAAYSVTNTLRNMAGDMPREEIPRMLQQALWEGARGHRPAERVLMSLQ